jgi:small-conductance mechanosensitive channel
MVRLVSGRRSMGWAARAALPQRLRPRRSWTVPLLGLLLLALGLLLQPGAGAWAEPASSTAASAKPAGAKMQNLMELLADPEIQAVLARRDGQGVEAAAHTAPPKTMAISLAGRLQTLRTHLIDLAAATATLPSEAETVRGMVAAALDQQGWWSVAFFFLAFVALGFGVEWLFRLAMRPAQHWLLGLTLESINERVRAVFARLIYGLGLLGSFALGSVGGFLLFDWPIAIKEILLGYLIAFLFVRLFAVLGRILLAPGAARFRVVPMSTAASLFLFRRWIVLAALLGFGWQTISLFGRFGLSPLSSELCGDLIGLVVMLLGLDIVWRVPRVRLTESSEPVRFADRHYPVLAMTASCLLGILWLLWVAEARQVFWLVAFAASLPLVIMLARRSVNHVLRPAGSTASAGDSQTLEVIVFERGVRTLIIVGAAVLLARIFDVDLVSLTMMQDTLTTRILRGAISVVVIGLAADFLWRVIKALIDRKLAKNMLPPDAGPEDAGHAARLQTLLPIISNMLFVVIIVIAGMMMLSAAGVEIGPLIASAGVVGVAIGFGAQTLVKDVISGIFYLFDDAFRIGEYIQSGTYKGTVESFSLRSVKLRHQRGALYTVPFGILGAVQNQSRDWVVDKIVMNVPYGTDLEKVRKLIKRIGETLSEDPEYAPDIINPLKMQGVVQFGDFAIQIQTKMMTKPGDVQFMARRRALLMINQAFSENGIGFAVPMVHVAGNPDAAAAAQRGFELLQAAKAK